MLLLGLDFETTGLDTSKDRIIEIGAAIWDTETGAPVCMQSDFVQHENLSLTDEIVNLTGITVDLIGDYGKSPEEAFHRLQSLIKSVNAVVAHNGTEFDKPMLQSQLKRMGWDWVNKPWIDTSTDIPYPEKLTTRKLVHLAAEHGFLNPFAHRALFDVLTMMRVLTQYNLEEVIRLASEPSITLRAMVSYDDRELAKGRGYRWNGEKKIWTKVLKQSRLGTEKEQAPFPVQELVNPS